MMKALIVTAALALPAAAQEADRGVGSDGVAPVTSDVSHEERDRQDVQERYSVAPELEDASRLADRSLGIDQGGIGRRTSENGVSDSGFSHRSWWRFWQDEPEKERTQQPQP